ncbi:ribonuclease D [Marinomonas ostreistagni]|uniref:ribonuclease D n=1 Tax=Marinomonas ostreistagni TaxID=359209 RepID=UPI0019506B7A|nr:ribonuclease D [Marinomonas ostreistagni]MBM6550325.1 ribonuclease D [Marinomonas ostreistagni]
MDIQNQTLDIVWVDTDSALRKWCEYWSTLSFIAVDTEFVRRTTYYPVTGLIQVSEGQQAVLIDPQTISDWAPLRELMVNQDVMKVFHACSEDLDVFDRLVGVLPTPFYDTQIGEAFASAQWSLSYVKLVKEYLDIDVAKDETRSDWTLRPLTDAQKRYAALDVIYLAELYPMQIERLTTKQMLDWVLEDCESLKWQYQQNNDPEQNWDGVKAAWRLKPKSLTLLRRLFIWRDERARESDVPKGQILKDRTLWSLAKTLPDNARDVGQAEDITPKQVRLYANTVIEHVALVNELSADEYQNALPAPLPSDAGDLSKAMRSHLKALAQQLEVAPEVVLKRKLLDPLMRHIYEGSPMDWSNPVFNGWRKEKVVAPLLEKFAN